MQALQFDIAKAFLDRGERIEKKYRRPSWYLTNHEFYKVINGYKFMLSYEALYSNYRSRTMITIVDNDGCKIPFEIADVIYQKFKQDDTNIELLPLFEYDGGSSNNPSVPIGAEEEYYRVVDEIKSFCTFTNLNLKMEYIFPEDVVEEIHKCRKNGFSTNIVASALNKKQFISNFEKFEKRESLDVDIITIFTMEQLEFVLKLLQSQ